MSKNKLHFDDAGFVYGYGDLPGTQYVEVDNFDEALQAFSDPALSRSFRFGSLDYPVR